MAKKTDGAAAADGAYHEHTFSAFGGHPLTLAVPVGSSVLGLADGVAVGDGAGSGGLAALGIHDAEQLVAVAAIPDARDGLQEALGVTKAALDNLVKDARKLLPAPVAERLEVPLPVMYGLGAVPPPDGPAPAGSGADDPVAAAAAEGVGAAGSANLISRMSPIRNQGNRGTCVSFTLTALHEYARRVRGDEVNLSEQHLYDEIKRIDMAPAACGTWQRVGATVLGQRGQCREVVWPYNPNLPCNNNGIMPGNARTDAAARKLGVGSLVPTNVAAIKAALATRRPVGFSIPVYSSWFRSAEVQRSGRITMPVPGDTQEGGHAILGVGYQDDPAYPGGGYFLIRNSWGTGWAYQSPYRQGYGTLPYAYVSGYNWEAYTLTAPVSLDEPTPAPAEETRRTVTITIRGNVNLVIE